MTKQELKQHLEKQYFVQHLCLESTEILEIKCNFKKSNLVLCINIFSSISLWKNALPQFGQLHQWSNLTNNQEDMQMY